MFDQQIKELHKYLTKKELIDSFSIVMQERKSIVQYVTNEYTWVLVPKDSRMTKKNYTTKYKIKDSSNLSNMFKKTPSSRMLRTL